MNKKQRKIILIGISLIIVSVIFPPWKEIVFLSQGKFELESAIYRFIFAQTRIESKTKDGQLVSFTEYRIDATRLILQWIFIALVIGGIILYLKDPPRD
jgi:hypothetical protein